MRIITLKPSDIMLVQPPGGQSGGEPSGDDTIRTEIEIAPKEKDQEEPESEPSDKGEQPPSDDKSGEPSDDTGDDGKGDKSDDTSDGEGEPSDDGKGDKSDTEGEPSDDGGDGDGKGEPSDDTSDGEGEPSDSKGGVGGSGKSKPKNKLDKLKKDIDIDDESPAADLLKHNRADDMHQIGSHDEEGDVASDQLYDDDELEMDDKDLSPEELEDNDISLDDALNNLIDTEREIKDEIVNQKNKAPKDSGLSDIHMSDKSVIQQTDVMVHITKWIKKIKGEQAKDLSDWQSDTPSRKITGLWGREMDSPPNEETTNKVILFIFDTSGSMSPVAKLVAAVCSDISIKMNKDKIVDKVAFLNFNGVWGSPKKFESVLGIKDRIRKFLRIGTNSDLKPAWNAIEKLMEKDKNLAKNISGIIIVSDFDLRPAVFTIPETIRKLNPSILALCLAGAEYGDVSRYAIKFLNANKSSAIFALSIFGKKVKVLNALRVGRTT